MEREMPWFKLTGDARITQRCATENCGGQPTERFEGGGYGSNYCSGCRAQIERQSKLPPHLRIAPTAN
jgi:hypothetical protein